MKTCVALNVIHLVKALHIQGVCFAGHVEEPTKTEANGKTWAALYLVRSERGEPAPNSPQIIAIYSLEFAGATDAW